MSQTYSLSEEEGKRPVEGFWPLSDQTNRRQLADLLGKLVTETAEKSQLDPDAVINSQRVKTGPVS